MWKKLKAILPNQIPSIDKDLSAGFNQQVEKAIFLFSKYEHLGTDEEVMKIFVDNGIVIKEAIEILLFLPIAFVRQWFKTLNWSDTYLECIDKKRTVKRKFSNTTSYQIIWQVTTKYFISKPDDDIILKVAGRSAEFQAINQLLLNDPHAKLNDIKLTQIVIIR